MLNSLEIIKSRLRRNILSYFYTNPEANLYLREIASILKEDPGNLSKEFSKLEKDGIFVSRVRGNQKYFSLNRKYPLYNELKSIIFKTVGVEGGLREIINDIDGVDIAFIYGSFAKNKEGGDSDIDLLIVGSPREDGLMQKIEEMESRVYREINYNIYSKKEFVNKIRQKESFIMNILGRPKIILKGDMDGI